MVVRGLCVIVLAACSSSSAQPAPAPPPMPTARIVVRASGASSRQPERARVLRRLLAQHAGKIQFAKPYGRVGLSLTQVVSGSLDDPDYAKRPVGTNHLSVVLLDEAAFAADESLTGFDGQWTLTKTIDGTLIVQSIRDTPYAPAKVATRGPMIEQTRRHLRSNNVNQRLAALDTLEQHHFLELVPDLIPLLDDARSQNAQQPPPGQRGAGPRVVQNEALTALRRMVEPLADERTPATADVAAWRAYWKQALTLDLKPSVLAAPAALIATISMNQQWPEIVATPDNGFAMTVTAMDPLPTDPQTLGVFVAHAPWDRRTWAQTAFHEALDVVEGPSNSLGVLSAGRDSKWRFAPVGTQGKERELGSKMSHAALGGWGRDAFALAYLDASKNLHVQALDRTGAPRGPARSLPLASQPLANYHHGIHPISIVRRRAGWLAAFETRGGIVTVAIDDSFAFGLPETISGAAHMAQPKLAASVDRVVIAWLTESKSRQLSVVVHDNAGQPMGPVTTIGAEVAFVAKPLALADGTFVIAWIEAESEVHVGRFSAKGALVASGIIESREASQFSLAVVPDGPQHVLVGMEELARYPFTLVARRVELAKLR